MATSACSIWTERKVQTIDIETLLTRVKARKRELGLDEADPSELRNRGTARTAEKRELLRRTDARARAAGKRPIASNY
jgi:hypothetical protein